MKFRFITVFLILIIATSCNEKTALETILNCSNSFSLSKTKEIKDVKKNFKIHVPTNWKTELYYDAFQSAVFTADTTKQLTETFILDTTWKNGELILDPAFEEKIKSNPELTVIASQFENIHDKPAYWHHSKGIKNNFEYHLLDVYIKTSIDSYILISTQVYGKENINKRFCESMQLIKTLEII